MAEWLSEQQELLPGVGLRGDSMFQPPEGTPPPTVVRVASSTFFPNLPNLPSRPSVASSTGRDNSARADDKTVSRHVVPSTTPRFAMNKGTGEEGPEEEFDPTKSVTVDAEYWMDTLTQVSETQALNVELVEQLAAAQAEALALRTQLEDHVVLEPIPVVRTRRSRGAATPDDSLSRSAEERGDERLLPPTGADEQATPLLERPTRSLIGTMRGQHGPLLSESGPSKSSSHHEPSGYHSSSATDVTPSGAGYHSCSATDATFVTAPSQRASGSETLQSDESRPLSSGAFRDVGEARNSSEKPLDHLIEQLSSGVSVPPESLLAELRETAVREEQLRRNLAVSQDVVEDYKTKFETLKTNWDRLNPSKERPGGGKNKQTGEGKGKQGEGKGKEEKSPRSRGKQGEEKSPRGRGKKGEEKSPRSRGKQVGESKGKQVEGKGKAKDKGKQGCGTPPVGGVE